MTASNPWTVVRRLRSSGDAGVGVMRDPEHDDRMCAVLSVTTIDGKRYVIEVTVDDLRGLRHDTDRLLTADADQVAQWWRTLADGADGRPKAPKRFARGSGA